MAGIMVGIPPPDQGDASRRPFLSLPAWQFIIWEHETVHLLEPLD